LRIINSGKFKNLREFAIFGSLPFRAMSKLFKSRQSRIILFIWIIGIIIISSFSALAGWGTPNKPSGVPDKDFNEVIMDITDWILGFVGILTLLFIIWGGIQYMTAAGNKDIMEKGKKTLKGGVTGLIIVGLSYAIVSVVVGAWLGTSEVSSLPCVKCSDINGDNIADVGDGVIIGTHFDKCIGDAGFFSDADLNDDGCINADDTDCLSEDWHKIRAEMPECP